MAIQWGRLHIHVERLSLFRSTHFATYVVVKGDFYGIFLYLCKLFKIIKSTNKERQK